MLGPHRRRRGRVRRHDLGPTLSQGHARRGRLRRGREAWRGKQFDPQMADAFLCIKDRIILEMHSETKKINMQQLGMLPS